MKNNKLLKQYEIKGIGTFQHVVYQTLPLYSVVSQTFTAITMYGVWEAKILGYLPWLSLPVFLILVVAGAIATLCFNYVFLYRGFWNFQNQQQFPEDGQMAKLIRKIVREELDRK
jgi:hypothetical protein